MLESGFSSATLCRRLAPIRDLPDVTRMRRSVLLLGGAVLLTVGTLLRTEAFAQAGGQTTLVYQGVDRHYVLRRLSNQTGPLAVVVALHGLNQPVGGFDEE